MTLLNLTFSHRIFTDNGDNERLLFLSVWVSVVPPLLCHGSDRKEVKGVGGVLSEGEGEALGGVGRLGLAGKHADMEQN